MGGRCHAQYQSCLEKLVEGFPGVQRLSFLPPVQGMRGPSLVWEVPSCLGAAAEARELRVCNGRSCHDERPSHHD